jgi:hypothetical protein
MSEVEKAINILIDVVKKEAPANAVGFSFFMNCMELNQSWDCRTAKELKEVGVTMKNIRGEWIT